MPDLAMTYCRFQNNMVRYVLSPSPLLTLRDTHPSSSLKNRPVDRNAQEREQTDKDRKGEAGEGEDANTF
jgi:hypothetical protein